MFEDTSDKIRRNLLALSTAVIISQFLGFNLTEPAVTFLGAGKVVIAHPERIWAGLLIVWLYLFYRYWTLKSTSATKDELKGEYRTGLQKKRIDNIKSIVVRECTGKKSLLGKTNIGSPANIGGTLMPDYLELIEHSIIFHPNTPPSELRSDHIKDVSIVLIFENPSSDVDFTKYKEALNKIGLGANPNDAKSFGVTFPAEITLYNIQKLNCKVRTIISIILKSEHFSEIASALLVSGLALIIIISKIF